MNANLAKADMMNADFAEAVTMRVVMIHFMKKEQKINIASSHHLLINSYVKLLLFLYLHPIPQCSRVNVSLRIIERLQLCSKPFNYNVPYSCIRRWLSYKHYAYR